MFVRGDRGFCSVECRTKHIAMEMAESFVARKKSTTTTASASSSGTDQMKDREGS